MLLYNPAFDFHHSLFRLLVLTERLHSRWVEPEKLRILDFYLLFPREISFIQVSRLQLPLKRKFQDYPQYEAIASPAKLFYRLETVFENSLKTLLATSLLTADRVKNSDVVRRTQVELPKELSDAIRNRERDSAEVIDFLIDQLSFFPLHGPEGLKARTKLLPSKNDRH